MKTARNLHFHGRDTRQTRAFSLIEMMIAIVILGLGLVMTATMFPVAWTRARTLTEYTTQRVISDSAATLITESLRPSGTAFINFVDGSGNPTGKYFLSGGSLAGDMFYDPVLHADGDINLRLPCAPPNQCYTHLSVVIPSDTRVHALHMQNLLADGTTVGEAPYQIEQMIKLCQGTGTQLTCRTDFPLGDYPVRCNSPLNQGAEFCQQSFFSPQVKVGVRMYPPLDEPAQDIASDAFANWFEKFNARRYAWTILHRLRRPIGPENVQPGPMSVPASTGLASLAASVAGTTRTFDFYLVTLKRPNVTSRYAVQDPASAPILKNDTVTAAIPTAKPETEDVLLPVAWRVQVEFPLNVKSRYGASLNPPDPPSGVPTEIQVPVTEVDSVSAPMVVGVFPSGTQFIDEITGQIYRVVRRRVNLTGTQSLLTLDREVLMEDLDNSFAFGGDGVIQRVDAVRTVWVFPPPVSERSGNNVVFEGSTPVIGIDIRTISLTPPG